DGLLDRGLGNFQPRERKRLCAAQAHRARPPVNAAHLAIRPGTDVQALLEDLQRSLEPQRNLALAIAATVEIDGLAENWRGAGCRCFRLDRHSIHPPLPTLPHPTTS